MQNKIDNLTLSAISEQAHFDGRDDSYCFDRCLKFNGKVGNQDINGVNRNYNCDSDQSVYEQQNPSNNLIITQKTLQTAQNYSNHDDTPPQPQTPNNPQIQITDLHILLNHLKHKQKQIDYYQNQNNKLLKLSSHKNIKQSAAVKQQKMEYEKYERKWLQIVWGIIVGFIVGVLGGM